MPTPTPSRGTHAEADAVTDAVTDTAAGTRADTGPDTAARTPADTGAHTAADTGAHAAADTGAHAAADAQPTFVDDAPTRPEPLVGDLPIPGDEPAPAPSFVRRMVLRSRKQWPYALVLLTMAIGLFRTVQYHWREGSAWIGGALLVAAVLRAVLPPRTAGMVAVRGRFVDVLWCVGLAACILFIAYTLKA